MLIKRLSLLLFFVITISTRLYAPLPTTDVFGSTSTGFAVAQQNANRINGAIKAAKEDDVDSLTNYLSMGIDIDAPLNDQKETLLHYAAVSGSKNTVLLLLSMGANIEASAINEWTAVSYAIYCGSVEASSKRAEVLKILIANNASIKKTFTHCTTLRDGTKVSRLLTPLGAAAMFNFDAAIPLLIQAGASVNPSDNAPECSPLCMAALEGHRSVVKQILAYGGKVDQVVGGFALPLAQAVLNGRADIVYELLQAGATPSLANSKGYTPLHFAAMKDHAAIAKLLLDAGADPSIKDKEGKCPIDFAPKDSTTYKILNKPEGWLSSMFCCGRRRSHRAKS